MLVRHEGRGWGVATVAAPDIHSPAASGACTPMLGYVLRSVDQTMGSLRTDVPSCVGLQGGATAGLTRPVV